MIASVIASGLAAWLASAPASGPPLAPTDESALYEPPVHDTVIEPVEITPPPPRGPVAEDLSSELPLDPEPPAPVQALVQAPTSLSLGMPPPPPPPDGAGRLVGGSLAIGLGFGAASVVVIESAREDGNPRFVATTFIPLGLISAGVGTYLLIRGAKARANFKDWQAFTHADSRATGSGLLVGGVMGTVIGGVTLVAAGVQASDPQSSLAPTLFGIGGASVAVGIGALTWGLLRRNRYRSWRQSTFLGATPTLTPLARGLSFGVAARF